MGTGQFVLNSLRVRPALGRELSNTDKLGIYLQLYNVKVDQQTHKTKGGEQLTVERFIAVETLAGGRYTIEVTGIDLLTKQTVVRRAEFTVKTVANGPGTRQQ